MAEPKFLLIGADSGLGRLLAARWDAARQPWVGTTRRKGNNARSNLVTLDLAEPPQWNEAFAGATAAMLCAAITNTARCRNNFEETSRVNVTHTAALAELFHAHDVPVIFLSTSLVFDGAKPFMPRDARPAPVSAYGRQKAAAEEAVLRAGGAVVRLTKVLAENFALPQQWRDARLRGENIEAFNDMVCAPIAGEWVAAALDALAWKFRPGIYQFSATRDLSYAELAAILLRRLGANTVRVRPVSWREIAPEIEHVPAHTTLAMGAPEAQLGFTAPDPAQVWAGWADGLVRG